MLGFFACDEGASKSTIVSGVLTAARNSATESQPVGDTFRLPSFTKDAAEVDKLKYWNMSKASKSLSWYTYAHTPVAPDLCVLRVGHTVAPNVCTWRHHRHQVFFGNFRNKMVTLATWPRSSFVISLGLRQRTTKLGTQVSERK